MYGRESIREGMTVYNRDGEKLGKVINLGPSEFEIEKKGFLSGRKDYLIGYDAITDIRGDDLIVSVMPAGAAAGEARTERGREFREEREMRVPLVEEELDVVKREKGGGDVRVRKTVETETRTIDVPLRHEEVHVERVPGSQSTASAADTNFREEEIRVPVRDEEVEVRKVPRVREELRLRKDVSEREQRVADTVRREEAEIEGEETTRRTEKEEPGITAPGRDPYGRY